MVELFHFLGKNLFSYASLKVFPFFVTFGKRWTKYLKFFHSDGKCPLPFVCVKRIYLLGKANKIEKIAPEEYTVIRNEATAVKRKDYRRKESNEMEDI